MPKPNPKKPKLDSTLIILSSDDDADKNLTTKIVEKACGVNPSSSVAGLKKKMKVKKKEKTCAKVIELKVLKFCFFD